MNRLMKRAYLIAALFVAIFAQSAAAQELEIRIQVSHSQLQGVDNSKYENMQKALNEFVTNQIWTNNVFKTEERIKCNMLLNITKEVYSDEFQATLQVVSSRPVYGTGYDSPMLNILDKNIQFKYADGETLIFNENSHDELTSLIAYYVYIIIGFDYDSFGKMGGTPYFEKAQKIVNNAQGSNYAGWKSFETNKRNRYWLAENLMNSIYAPIREYIYKYHRLGLDLMGTRLADGCASIAEGMNDLLKVHRQKSDSYLMSIFFDAKADEIVNIFSNSSDQAQQNKVYNFLKEIDASNLSKYDKIKKK
ncbi:MAG: DUF4835 family protein [Salinivirgaceae bacterium]|nr:DUF4835 family protein [Salinivirgaceae bacterium]MBR4621462.1 DUF4835 family protein [Salinivirgaceae bacterium]